MKALKAKPDINDLMNHVISTMNKLDNGKITVSHAATISKLHTVAQGWIAYELILKRNNDSLSE